MYRLALLSSCLVHLCAAFAPLAPTLAPTRMPTTSTSLSSTLYLEDHDDDLSFRHMMTKARECAFSDVGSAVDARVFLHEILLLESGCVSGTLSGAICENVDEVADLVAHLRVKAAGKANAAAVAEVAMPAAVPGIVLTALFAMTFAILLTTMDTGSGATPYTMQEWVWAAQGGYLDNMVEHYMRNGGL